MKFLVKLSLVIAMISVVGCNQCIIKQKPATFSTPFGQITKGDSMSEVIGVLGNPEDISYQGRREVWHYDFTETGEVSAYFEKGDLIDIQFLNQPSECVDCKANE